MDYQKAFYLCKAEVEQRDRDIKRAINEARMKVETPEVWDLLSNIWHHSEMAVWEFDRREKELEIEEPEDTMSIMGRMDKIKNLADKLKQEVV